MKNLKKVLILETVRDSAKWTNIWDHIHYNGKDDQNFKNFNFLLSVFRRIS